MDNKYLLVINGKPEGPFDMDELKQRGIRPTDFVRTDGMSDYKEAHEVAELRQLFGFRKQIVLPQYFGGFDQRMLASVIDWLIVMAWFVVPAFVAILFIENKMVRLILPVSLLVFIPLAYFIYHVVMEGSAKQGTYGKQILKIRVSDTNGEPIDKAKAFARNLAKLLSVLTFPIGYILLFLNKKRQCLHDMVAETLVIKDRLD
ncbi:RDD family protein [Mucilaginibacter myungsuensis]|uniref:RDD family protein n=1 Tax=Mucilaginibacter myungsuensis TaxID=649104 RepID=A0A929KSH5_9SPHI|nr:RDD family protein [Mucilaginibacter myungsuensis]MBE9660699.1 RDD family protein [Mucilaginibacter myungsuensis]MDN3600744.1 RDD family protein [Mucilaginibacter myungsuensis]